MMNINKAMAMSGLSRKAQIMYGAFERDVESAKYSHQHFSRLNLNVRMSPNTSKIGEILHHATCFVCAVRRVYRILVTMRGCRDFGVKTKKAIKLELKKKKVFFDGFVDPRNAIEHIDEEAKADINFGYFNLINDTLSVTLSTEKEVKVDIGESALNSIISCCIVIEKALIEDDKP